MKLVVIHVYLLLSIVFVDAALAVTYIRDDMGGSLGKYLLMFAKIRDSGERVVIDGNCFSACTLVTTLPKDRICITERAVLGFHAGWIDQTGKQVISSEGTRLLFELYPPRIRSWISKHGGLGASTLILKGRELASFYSPCE